MTYVGNPLGWRAHGRNARGQADHEELAHMVNRKEYDLFRVTTNLILFRETGVLDRELNLASIPFGVSRGSTSLLPSRSYIT